MTRLFSFIVCALLLSSFVTEPPITGKWSTCGNIKVGSARIEFRKYVPVPCNGDITSWTDMTFDTAHGQQVLICNSSCGNLPKGVPCLASGGSCHYGKWAYDPTTSTLMITDSTTVYYLVSSISDTSMVLIKK